MYETTITTTTIETEAGMRDVPAARVWHVYEQAWRIYPVDAVPDAVLASLPQRDRDAIEAAR